MSDMLNEKFEEFVTEQKVIVEAGDPMPTVSANIIPGAGSELYRGLGSVVLGGLVISTIFTLFLIPTLFTLMVDAQNALAKNYADAESEPATLPTQSETDHAEGAEDSAPASHATDESEATEDEPAKDTSETEAPVSTNTGS